MHLSRHVFERNILLADASIDPVATVLYLPHPEGVPFDAHKIGKARSSWALRSRLHGLKKRDCPPASSKSLTTMESRSGPNRKPKMDALETPEVDPLVESSRWEPSVVNSKPLSSSRKKSNRRPTMPKRQQSIEPTSKDQTVASRKARINQASSNNEALRISHD